MIFLGCVLRAVRGQVTWRKQILKICKNRKPKASNSKDAKKPRSIRKNILRNSARKRNSKTSWPSQTVIYSGRKPRARRWWWNRRRRQEGKHNQRFVVHVWRFYLSTSWRTLIETDNETFPIPLKYVDVMGQTQTSMNNVSEQNVNDIWTEAKGVILSGSALGLQDSRSNVQGFLKDASGEMEEDPKYYRTRQYLAWSLDTFIQETKWRGNCKMRTRKLQTAYYTPQQAQQGNLQGINRWHR